MKSTRIRKYINKIPKKKIQDTNTVLTLMTHSSGYASKITNQLSCIHKMEYQNDSCTAAEIYNFFLRVQL